MRYHEILMEMSRAEAAAIWRRNGEDPEAAPDELKKAHRKMVKQLHPDRSGGNLEKMQQVNAAYDVLKKGGDYETPRRPPQRKPEEDAPWAHAGWSGGMPNSSSIYRQDYRDMNYIKKRMWELSGHSNVQWIIQGFDGYFMRHSLTVYGSPKIFAQMAEAMITWQTKGGNPYDCRAVLTQKRRGDRNQWLIIWADGVFYDKDPIPFESEYNNQRLGDELRRVLDDLKENGGRVHEQSEMDTKGATNEKDANFDVGDFVWHPKYGPGVVINPQVKSGMARVTFKKNGETKTGNVKLSSLRKATTQEQWQFEHGK